LLEEMVKIATIPRYQGNPVGWMVSSGDTGALLRGVRGGTGAGCVTYVGPDNTV
jgi:hypothetical protein